MKIGIFDSGVGGEAVARDLKSHFPHASIISVSDREHLPYGSRTEADILQLADAAIQPLLTAKCDVIVIACNTVTTIALPTLKKRYPDQSFIGFEPMVVTASQTSTNKKICVCATPATLRSDRYQQLKTPLLSECKIYEPDCSDWARMIEDNEVNEEHIAERIMPLVAEGVDIIVLGCTHYHWIKELITSIANGDAVVIEPTEYIAQQITERAGEQRL